MGSHLCHFVSVGIILDRKDLERLVFALDLMISHVDAWYPAGKLFHGGFGDKYSTGPGEIFHAGGDVHRFTKNVLIFYEDCAGVDAYSDEDFFVAALIEGEQFGLHFPCGIAGLESVVKAHHKGIANFLDQSTVVLFKDWHEQFVMNGKQGHGIEQHLLCGFRRKTYNVGKHNGFFESEFFHQLFIKLFTAAAIGESFGQQQFNVGIRKFLKLHFLQSRFAKIILAVLYRFGLEQHIELFEFLFKIAFDKLFL
ncbi:MAG: hypothetical protein ACD_39C00835G0003 [uncultured bacterium]|nr:MAG: hypothetical protein ACD_39C00835G0003 [uncultured bacterium]